MDFEFTQEQTALRRFIREFIEKNAPPYRQREFDESETFPAEIWDNFAKTGLFGVAIDKKYGGKGGNIIDMVLTVEELSRGMFAFGDAFMQFSCFGPSTINFFGSEIQKRQFLPLMAKGAIKVCLGITESHGGTDALRLSTSATETEEGYIINGEKIFTTGAHLSDYIMLVARTSESEKKRSYGISIFMVDMKTKGISVSKLKKVGLRALGTCQVSFNNVLAPKDSLVGERDRGWYHIVDTLNNERIVIAAAALGNSLAAFEDAKAYYQQKCLKANGTPGAAVADTLAEMAMRIELSRLMIYKAAWLQSNGLPCMKEASIAKLVASETNIYVSSQGMDILGQTGCQTDCAMQRYWRDSKLFEFAPISNEMVRNLVGESMGLPRSF